MPDTAPVPAPNWVHPAEVVRVIDGDTFIARIDLGRYFGGGKVISEGPIRVVGLYCAELHEKGGPEAGLAARDLLRAHGLPVVNPPVTLATRKPDSKDPYGRVLADVWLPDGRSFADEMTRLGYNGKGKGAA
jgi:endonuclease YncB( thermonuclease family)